jgi:hypothetical protein
MPFSDDATPHSALIESKRVQYILGAFKPSGSPAQKLIKGSLGSGAELSAIFCILAA